MRRGNDAGSAHCYTPPMQPGSSVAVPYDASRRHLNKGESAFGVLPIPSSPRNTEPRSSRHLQTHRSTRLAWVTTVMPAMAAAQQRGDRAAYLKEEGPARRMAMKSCAA